MCRRFAQNLLLRESQSFVLVLLQLDTSRQYTHVFALYLLNYAKTREQLLGFVKVGR